MSKVMARSERVGVKVLRLDWVSELVDGGMNRGRTVEVPTKAQDVVLECFNEPKSFHYSNWVLLEVKIIATLESKSFESQGVLDHLFVNLEVHFFIPPKCWRFLLSVQIVADSRVLLGVFLHCSFYHASVATWTHHCFIAFKDETTSAVECSNKSTWLLKCPLPENLLLSGLIWFHNHPASFPIALLKLWAKTIRTCNHNIISITPPQPDKHRKALLHLNIIIIHRI